MQLNDRESRRDGSVRANLDGHFGLYRELAELTRVYSGPVLPDFISKQRSPDRPVHPELRGCPRPGATHLIADHGLTIA